MVREATAQAEAKTLTPSGKEPSMRPCIGRRLLVHRWAAVRSAAGGLLVAFLVGPPSVSAQEGGIAGRRGFSLPEQPVAGGPASCAELAGALDPPPRPEGRIDLAVVGPLTLVQTDGALWYLAVCSAPGIRVMCVTYERNDLKLGDRVVLRGGYNRQDERHIVIDPCLASRS
jgi:hypothetical protein